MKTEILARIVVILLVAVAISIPFAGPMLMTKLSPVQVVDLHARMPENGGWSMDTITAEVGKPLLLRITSEDVVHGFAIGRMDLPPVDIRPGEVVETTLTFDRPGKYTYYCTRWCGMNHWRMRGTIEVTGLGTPVPPDPQPLFLKLGLALDMPEPAEVTPAAPPAADRGSQFAGLLPTYAVSRDTYLTSSPAQLWQRLRGEASLAELSDGDLWDAVAWIWQQQTNPEKLAAGQKLFAANCAACHGESGKGDGVMVRGFPVWDPASMQAIGGDSSSLAERLFSPPDFSDPKVLLGTSPAFLEGKMIRGGMGTGMPYWGPILTSDQMDEIIAYLYNFVGKK